MSTLRQVKAAENRMNEAQGALGAYAERPRSQLQNIDLHRRLAEELIKATNEYIRLIFEVETHSR
jgi:hypothetical protein